jgi:hypothetical protein
MLYAVEDIVTVSQARGRWIGIITEIKTIGKEWAYLVHPLDTFEEIELRTQEARTPVTVLEADIISANRNYPTFEVGEYVNMFGISGEITGIDGDLYRVETQTPRKDYTQIRDHFVTRVELLLFNPLKYQVPV